MSDLGKRFVSLAHEIASFQDHLDVDSLPQSHASFSHRPQPSAFLVDFSQRDVAQINTNWGRVIVSRGIWISCLLQQREGQV